MNRNRIGQSILLTLPAFLAGMISLGMLAPPVAEAKSPGADDPKADKQTSGEQVADKQEKNNAAETDKKDAKKDAKPKDWKPLKGSWKECQFGGDGGVEMKDGLFKIEMGDPMTGIRWEGDVPRENYELELEARRTDGFDFFCGLTFPVGKDQVSFILGGWGGGVVGISSIDDRDASDNQTTSFRNFDNDKWYRVRVRVEPNEIRCWIDDKAAAEVIRKGHTFDIRYEMDPCVPLGIAAFQCDAEYRKIRWRKLTKQEVNEANKKLDLTDE